MRYKITKKILMFWCLFVAIGAIYGSICMFIDPTGKILSMEGLLPYFNVLPFSDILFQNYIFPGISLLIINGLTNLVAIYFLIKDKKIGTILGATFGGTLMFWIIIQFIILPQNAMSIIFFIVGFIQLITGYMAYVFYMQEHFIFDIKDYKNIETNKNTIVIYFSRMGYTKKVAYEEADKLGADIYEIKTIEKTNGTLGFWWAGRYGMHRWNMKIENINLDLKKYSNIVIVSPIWVFSISAPIREFCYKYKNDINNVQYIFTHFMNATFENTANEVDKILNKKRTHFKSICIRFGKIKKIYEEKEQGRKN